MKINLIPNASKMWRAWSVQAAILGAALPEVLQVIASNTEALPWFDAGAKEAIRVARLVGVVLLRPIKQGAL